MAGEAGSIQSDKQAFYEVGQGPDAAYREKPIVGPVNEELTRSSGSTVVGIGSTTLPVGLNSGTGTSGTGNGPVQSQVTEYNASFGQKTEGYKIPPRTP